MAAKNINARNYRTNGNAAVDYTYGRQSKVTPFPRNRVKKEVYSGQALIIVLIAIILTGWISCSLISTGYQHWKISSQISDLEAYENQSYGQGRWDQDAIDEYNELLQKRNDFAESSDLARWSVYSTAGTIFGFFVRMAVYLAAFACVYYDLRGLWAIGSVIRKVILRKAVIKFDR